jgi:1-aminocyclopropane-1-carboxylate deaminase
MKMGVIEYHFGGYGKVTQDLVAFINEFYEK